MLLKGKVVLITGAARGIGRSTAMVLAEQGADVGVADILPEVEQTAIDIEKAGGNTKSVRFDISDPNQVQQGVSEIRNTLGDIDILVNNAAIVTNIARLTKMSIEAWQQEINVNLSGAFHLVRQVIGPMIEKQWGRIINISSGAATGGLHKQIGYASSKAGLLGMTKTIALEHARDGVTCNAILPGLIETELVKMMPEEMVALLAAQIPTRRTGRPEEIGHLIGFLASDLAGYINGASIPIDGGATLNIVTFGSKKELDAMLSTDGK